jgi:hypothetical protein
MLGHELFPTGEGRKVNHRHTQESFMRTKFTLAAVSAALLMAAGTANAGCGKGALAGGVVGHVAGKHGVAGAAIGCAIGHHAAKKKEKQAAAAAAAQNNAAAQQQVSKQKK